MPTREELTAALKVFTPWLEEEVREMELAVARGYKAKTTLPTEIAELVGMARGLEQAVPFLTARIENLPGE